MAKDINFSKEFQSVIKAVTQAVNAGVDELKNNIDSKTPEDTKTLLGNNKIKKASLSGEQITASVSNDTEYAQYVEYGIWWRKYRYNKPKGNVFYTGVGARMFTRASDESQDKITKDITTALDAELKKWANK